MTNDSVPSVGVAAASLGRTLRSRWYMIAICAGVGMLLAVFAMNRLPATYQASATVTVNPITSDIFATGSLAQLVNVATEVQVLKSESVLSRAADALADGTTVADLSAGIDVAIPTDSLAMTVIATAPTPEGAATRANGIAQAYLEYRKSVAVGQLNAYQKLAQERIAELSANADPATARELADLRTDLSRSNLTVINPGAMVNPASVPTSPASPKLSTLLAAGLALGLLIGVALTLLLKARRSVVESGYDVEQLVPGHYITFSAVVPVDLQQLMGQGSYVPANDDNPMLGMAIELHRALPAGGRLCLVGDPSLGPIATRFVAEYDRVAGASDGPVSTAVDLTSAGKGEASFACSSSQGVVVLAAEKSTRTRQLRERIGQPLRVTPHNVPVGLILVSNGGKKRLSKQQSPSATRKRVRSRSENQGVSGARCRGHRQVCGGVQEHSTARTKRVYGSERYATSLQLLGPGLCRSAVDSGDHVGGPCDGCQEVLVLQFSKD